MCSVIIFICFKVNYILDDQLHNKFFIQIQYSERRKKLNISQKKLNINPKKVGHRPKKSWTFPKKSWTFSKKYVGHYLKYALLFKIIFYLKIKFWTLPRRSRRSSIFYRIFRGRLPHPQPIPIKHALNPIRK